MFTIEAAHAKLLLSEYKEIYQPCATSQLFLQKSIEKEGRQMNEVFHSTHFKLEKVSNSIYAATVI